MNRPQWSVAVFLLLALSASCADPKQVAEVEKRLAAVEKKNADLEAQVKALGDSVKALEEQVTSDVFAKDVDATAYLTPGSTGYDVIQTDLGRVTVKLANVEPYANGSRVTLQFGNLTSAVINGAKAKLQWGSVDKSGLPQMGTAKSRDVTFSESLRAGAWTNVLVVLEGVPPTDLGFVRITEMAHTGISLIR